MYKVIEGFKIKSRRKSTISKMAEVMWKKPRVPFYARFQNNESLLGTCIYHGGKNDGEALEKAVIFDLDGVLIDSILFTIKLGEKPFERPTLLSVKKKYMREKVKKVKLP